jgi:hypothetical protein
MTIINLYTRDQELYTKERPKVASGNEETVQLFVSFDSAWDGYAKSAVFHTAKDSTVYEAVLVGLSKHASRGHRSIRIQGYGPYALY